MTLCEFCSHYNSDLTCKLGLRIPKSMNCREFTPVLENFCANPNDFVDPKQIIGMAVFFGIKGSQLAKIERMAAQEETDRSL